LTETLLGFVLTRLGQVEAPVILHGEIEAFPAEEIKNLLQAGVLRETSHATEISRPARLSPGDDLVVRRTAQGLFGVAEEDEYLDPVPLTEDDIRQYELVASRLARHIHRANSLQGVLHQEGEHLFSLGEKQLPWGLRASVYLSLLNTGETDLLAVAERLRPMQPKPVVLLTPTPVPLSVTAQQALAGSETHVIPLSDHLEAGSWAIAWEETLPGRGERGEITARNAYCFAVTHDGRRYLDEEGYQQLVAATDDYDVFADELTHEVTKKQGKESIRKTGISASYFQVLRAVVEKRGYYDPKDDDPEPEQRWSAKQIVQRARKAIDVSYTDHEGKKSWRLFKSHKPGNRAVYQFDPAPGFCFALVFLPQD
jgi:hypothetical protein